MLKERYDLPNTLVLIECVQYLEMLFYDLISPYGEETVLLELYSAILMHSFFENQNIEQCYEILGKYSQVVQNAVMIPPELVLNFHI